MINNNAFTWYYVQGLDDSVITNSKNNLLTAAMLNLVSCQLLIFKLNIEMWYWYSLRTLK